MGVKGLSSSQFNPFQQQFTLIHYVCIQDNTQLITTLTYTLSYNRVIKKDA